LARPDASTLVLMGGGEQARHHIHAISTVRTLDRIIVWGRSPDRLKAFAGDMAEEGFTVEPETDAEKAVQQADILCTVTSSTQPILKGAWLTPGTHVNLVGAAVRTSAEADTDVVTAGAFYIDYLPSALDQAGELLAAMEAGVFQAEDMAGEIGDVVRGNKPGRAGPDQITVYKSLGVAAQDLAGARGALDAAKEKGLGIEIPWEG